MGCLGRLRSHRAGEQAIDIRGPASKVVADMGLLDRAPAMRTHLQCV
jgi:hypothetical protein